MELGMMALWLVVVLAPATVVLARRPVSGCLLVGAAVAATVALGDLAWAFVARDWGLVQVVDHTRSGVGPLLRLAGLWAGPEGSLLMWTAMSAWAALLAVLWTAQRGPGPAATAWARRLGGGVVGAYALVLAVAAPPFERLAVPAVDGLGLQPVLEYPAMVWHPPLLYAGLLGLLVPMIVAGAGAAVGASVVPGRRLLGPPLALLTAGLLSGALWANVELGWGGYWAWDPIESAGLVAWCCGVAALHAGGPSGRVAPNPGVAVALGLAPGLAAVWATTLTRVGLVSSVHAFADRPALRIGLLVVAGLISVAVALLIAVAGRSGTGSAVVPARGRDGFAGDGSVQGAGGRGHAAAVLTAAGFFVAVGAYEPLVEAATTGDAVAIAGHYYSRMLWPVALGGVALAVLADWRRPGSVGWPRAGFVGWYRAGFVGWYRAGFAGEGGPGTGGGDVRGIGPGGGRRGWPALAGVAVAVVAAPEASPLYGVILGAAGGGLIGSSLGRRAPRLRAGTLAHVGVGVFLIGVAGTTAGLTDVVDAPLGQPVTAADLTLEHRALELVERSTTREAVATVAVDGYEFRPRLVVHQLRGASSSEVAWRFDGLDEIQVLLVDGSDAAARYQVNRLPRVAMVWLGGLVTTGGLIGAGLGARNRERRRPDDSGRGSATTGHTELYAP